MDAVVERLRVGAHAVRRRELQGVTAADGEVALDGRGPVAVVGEGGAGRRGRCR